MTSIEDAYHRRLPRSFRVRAVLEACRHVTRAQIQAALMFGCTVFIYHVIVFSPGLLQKPSPMLSLIEGFLADQGGALVLMLAVRAAEDVAGTQRGRRTAYALAVLVSAAIAALLPQMAPAWSRLPEFSWMEALKSTLYSFFEWLALGGAATFIYLDRRRARAALARMRAAEIERAHTAKRMLESRLQAMQARVEPQFLFNTLTQVRDLYRASAARGERMLDEMIAYLRAAMPKMRDTSSTVGQELELVRAYLGIVCLRLGERLAFDIETPDQIADARMPPMMLLPLIDHAIAHRLAEPHATGSILIRTRIADKKVRLEIADSGPGFLPSGEVEGIAGIRARLFALYGGDGSLVLRRTAGRATEAVLEMRCEPGEALLARGD